MRSSMYSIILAWFRLAGAGKPGYSSMPSKSSPCKYGRCSPPCNHAAPPAIMEGAAPPAIMEGAAAPAIEHGIGQRTFWGLGLGVQLVLAYAFMSFWNRAYTCMPYTYIPPPYRPS